MNLFRNRFILSALLAQTALSPLLAHATQKQATLNSREIPIIEVKGLRFRDLNKNQKLDPYEDWRLSAKKRSADLLKRMSLQEKLGQLAHSNIFANAPFGQPATGYNMPPLEGSILKQAITSYIPHVSLNVQQFAEQNNLAQKIAERGRLGIPLTLSTDPRHHFQSTIGASASGEGFSRWPETLGFAAINQPELTQRFASIVRQEYRAVGFNQALSPQADISTEPRWARSYGTFGEDANIVGQHVAAYVAGMQGATNGVQAGAVPAVVKHWVGYGAAKDGWDAHNYYGRFSSLTEQSFPLHAAPFKPAFTNQVSGVMPAYSIFEQLAFNGKKVEAVGAGFSKTLIKNQLRKKYKFKGFVLSDWNIVNDCSKNCQDGMPPGQRPDPSTIATPWGVLQKSQAERVALAIKAGVDQLGGLMSTQPIQEALDKGLISTRDIDRAAKNVLMKSFRSGIFEAPFVDESAVAKQVNAPEAAKLAMQAQAQAITVLKRPSDSQLLPAGKHKVFLHKADASAFQAAGHTVVEQAKEAHVALIRLSTPYETLHPGYFFGAIQHEGNLAFNEDHEAIKLLKQLRQQNPNIRIIVDINLDRPAILSNIVPLTDVLVANYGASEQALLKALSGQIEPIGKLPFELPASMAAVEAQDSAQPADSEKPLFPLHFSAPKAD